MPPGLGKATAATQQTALPVEVVKQILGKETAERRVKVKAPGKFFSQLLPSEQAAKITVILVFSCPVVSKDTDFSPKMYE